jgi:hypothetical protein
MLKQVQHAKQSPVPGTEAIPGTRYRGKALGTWYPQTSQIDTGNLFEGLKRIAKDISANANNDLIEHAFRMGYLYDEKEYRFLKQTALKRILSPAQAAWKRKINRRILSKTIVQRRSKT